MSEELKYKGYTIKVIQDSDPMNPRDDDNLGVMCCYHRNYQLGDTKHDHPSPEALKEFLKANADKIVQLPLYLYDHSGITMNTTGYSHCDSQGWDWGQVGVIYITYEKIRKEYGWKALTKKRLAKIASYLQGEVETYDQFLTGDVYGYQVVDSKGEDADSCWGYFGHDHKSSGLLDSAQNAVDCDIVSKQKASTKKLKALIRGKAPLETRAAVLA